MTAIPVIVAALAGVILIRLALRRKRTSSPSPFGWIAARVRCRKLFGETGLVAGREIRERLRSRLFRLVTAILLAVVAAAVVIPTVHSGTTQSQRIGVVAGSPSLTAELQDLARSAGITVQLVSEPGLPQARAALSAGRLDMVVDGTGEILVKNPISASDTSAGARYVRDVSLSLGEQRAFAQAGLTSKQAAIVATAGPLPVESIQPGKTPRTTSEATALLGVILIFIVLTQYLTWTLMGVMEEKASRVVEVLLATVRPIQLLGGKVIGIGAVALAQAAALVAVALVLAEAVGSSLVHGTAPLVAAATLAWLVLGYAFYSWVYARRLSGRATGPSPKPGAATERAPDLRLHCLPDRGQLGQRLAVAEGPGLSATHRPVRHADPGRVWPSNLVAIPALSGGEPGVHRCHCPSRSAGIPRGGVANRWTGPATRTGPDVDGLSGGTSLADDESLVRRLPG
jgi:ABC-2 type transport system permease protein